MGWFKRRKADKQVSRVAEQGGVNTRHYWSVLDEKDLATSRSLMNYHEASTLAKNNPGSTLTRDACGMFIVRHPNGSLLTLDKHEDPINEREPSHLGEICVLKEEIDLLKESATKEKERFDKEISALNLKLLDERSVLIEKIGLLKASATTEKRRFDKEISALNLKLTEANSELDRLAQKLKRVSEEDWQKIEAREQFGRKKSIKQSLKERITVKCGCQGANENCPRCYGSGTYIVDGRGNPK